MGVNILPSDYEISIDINSHTPQLQLQKTTRPCRESMSRDYEAALPEFIRRAHARLWALRRAGIRAFNLNMSGGRDSRMCFGLLLTSGMDKEHIGIASDKRRTADFDVVNTILKHYNTPLRRIEKNINWSRIHGASTYDLWKLGCVGVYSPVYEVGTTNKDGFGTVTGAAFREMTYVSLNPIDKLSYFLKKVATYYHDRFSEMFFSSFEHMGVDVHDTWAMARHYKEFRARFHYGRNSYKDLGHSTLITPLMTSELEYISDLIGWRGYVNGQLEHDLLRICDPDLLEFGFDKDSKNFSSNIDKPFWSGKKVGNLSFSRANTLSVFGRITEGCIIEEAISDEGGKSFIDMLFSEYNSVRDSVAKSLAVPHEIFIDADHNMERIKFGDRAYRTAEALLGLGWWWRWGNC